MGRFGSKNEWHMWRVRHFSWLVGIMFTMLLAVVGTVLSTSASILAALSAR